MLAVMLPAAAAAGGSCANCLATAQVSTTAQPTRREGEKRGEMGGADDGEEERVGRRRPGAEMLTAMARLGDDCAAASDGEMAAVAARGEGICATLDASTRGRCDGGDAATMGRGGWEVVVAVR
uniref:DUF834 domain-containing protein n=1 Tax=Oryza rufipogon TaxID=4529 RepID=A0A0E0QDT1_ORYRU